MKHIFTIHSPITFFAAYCIIFQENLLEEDVIIITNHYKLPLEIGTVVSAYQEQETNLLKKLKNFNLPKAYDKYINSITNCQPFTAYIDLMHAYQRILITHPRCHCFHFIEEGTASYVVPDNLAFITRGAGQEGFRNMNLREHNLSLLRVLRGQNLRLFSLPFIPQAYTYLEHIKYYTFSPIGYPGVVTTKKVILNPKSGNLNHIIQLIKVDNLNNGLVWVEESFPRVYGVKEPNYIHAIEQMAKHLSSKGHEKIYLKLRPNSSKNNSILFKTLQKSHLSIQIIAKEVIAEAIFLNSSNLTVVGVVSSLLFYATIWGHKAISFIDLIKDRPATPFDNLAFFWDKVEKVKRV